MKLRRLLALLAIAAVPLLRYQWTNRLELEVLLYVVALLGVGLHLWWGRGFAICLAASRLAIELSTIPILAAHTLRSVEACDPCLLAMVGAKIAVIALLATGPACPRGQATRWPLDLDPRLRRLRWVILAQATLLATTWDLHGAGLCRDCVWWIITLSTGAMVGLALQKTWGLLLLLPAVAFEVPVLLETAQLWMLKPGYFSALFCAITIVIGASIVLSLVIAAPVFWAVVRSPWRCLRFRLDF